MTSKVGKVMLAVLIAVVFLSAISGTMIYYNGLLAGKDSRIASLGAQIENQNDDIANLSSEVSQELNLSKPCQAAALGVSEVAPWDVYWRLFIEGTVGNLGNGTAYNAGLRVIAYSNVGKLAINMTVPFANGYNCATDSRINATLIQLGPTQLGNLTARTSAAVNLDIYREGVIVNWTVTPVWTDTP
jgi:hypothetical protein